MWESDWSSGLFSFSSRRGFRRIAGFSLEDNFELRYVEWSEDLEADLPEGFNYKELCEELQKIVRINRLKIITGVLVR
jgi:hypothetical protein